MMMMKLVLMLMLTTLNRIATFYRTYCYLDTSYPNLQYCVHPILTVTHPILTVTHPILTGILTYSTVSWPLLYCTSYSDRYTSYPDRYTSYSDRYTSIHLHCMQVQDLHTTPVSAITAQTYMEQELGRRLRMKRCTPWLRVDDGLYSTYIMTVVVVVEMLSWNSHLLSHPRY